MIGASQALPLALLTYADWMNLLMSKKYKFKGNHLQNDPWKKSWISSPVIKESKVSDHLPPPSPQLIRLDDKTRRPVSLLSRRLHEQLRCKDKYARRAAPPRQGGTHQRILVMNFQRSGSISDLIVQIKSLYWMTPFWWGMLCDKSLTS